MREYRRRATLARDGGPEARDDAADFIEGRRGVRGATKPPFLHVYARARTPVLVFGVQWA